MDTLSRKHRLRQQRERSSQQVVYGKENQNEQFEKYEADCNKSTTTTNHMTTYMTTNNNNSEENEEHFRVFRLVEIRGKGDTAKYDEYCNGMLDKSASGSKLNSIDRYSIERRDKNDQVFPIVYMPTATLQQQPKQQQVSDSLKKPELIYLAANNHYSSGSTRSIGGDSSGFLSEGSGTQNSQSQLNGLTYRGLSSGNFCGPLGNQPNHSVENTTRVRSKVIDDLDRLMVDVDRCNSMSPTDSYISCSTLTKRDTTLTRGKEFHYSTLCRDEFSSFIALNYDNPPEAPKELLHKTLTECEPEPMDRSGPMLVGVHESNNNRPPKINANNCQSIGSPTGSDPFELQQIRSSSSWQSFTSSPNEQSIDGELLLIDNQYPLNARSLVESESNKNLSEMLDVYLNRVECLLKLSTGNKFVSMNDAFGDDIDICVSDENRTAIEFLPSKHQNQVKVIQEIKMIEMTIEEGDEFEQVLDERRCITDISIVDSDFRSIMWTPQTSAKLNWHADNSIKWWPELRRSAWPREEEAIDLVEITRQQQKQLEESLLSRLLDCDNPLSANEKHNTTDLSNLVNTVRRHMSEFIKDYNTYQRELKAKTSFANDWHQNWLFAYKRPNESSIEDEYYDSANSPKRAKMSSIDSESDHQLDLIEYATLILANKCTPIKLIYMTGEQQQLAGSTADIERLYEAQEDEMSELYSCAIKSSGQIDPCRMLLSDMDGEENIQNLAENQRKQADRSRRNLLISYNSSSVPQCKHQFRFFAYGYLFESPIPMLASWSSGRKMLKLRENILTKLEGMFKSIPRVCLVENQRCGEANEPVRFLVNLANVELVNKLPVIQFCAKVSGSLPVKVRWFRVNADAVATAACQDEVSDISTSSMSSIRRKSLNIKATDLAFKHERIGASWPIEMHAYYDYEYQNEWSSWFRFRRCQGDILFQIREANFEMDYNQSYKCVIENYCSRKECIFSLTSCQTKQMDTVAAASKVDNKIDINRKAGERQNISGSRDSHALLRTWSQRTLHKCKSNRQEPAENDKSNDAQAKPESARKSWQQTIGRRSAFVATMDEDKFGKNFPYHPENLLKRLEENKFSVSLKCKLNNNSNNHKQPPLVTSNGSLRASPQMHFTHSFELIRGQESGQQQQRQQEEQVSSNEKQTIQAPRTEVKAQVPKPRLRFKANSSLEQVSRLTDHESCNLVDGQQIQSAPISKVEFTQRLDMQQQVEVQTTAGSQRHQLEREKLENSYRSADKVRAIPSSDHFQQPNEDCKPKTNVKSLISRFSLA